MTVHRHKDGRNARQSQVRGWCIDAFGAEHATNVPQRGIRLAEEAIEAAQGAGCTREMVVRLVHHVFDKPPGELRQEIGGVGVTLLALAAAANVSADGCERVELERVLAKPVAHFAARNAAKNAAGFYVPPTTSLHEPCSYCVGAGGWEAAPGATKHEWRLCHECNGSGRAKDIAA